MLVQSNELNERVDSMAASTIEKLQSTLETSHTEVSARFVSRLREQVAPVLAEARADLKKLAASQTTLKEESQAICARVTSELETGVQAKLLQTHADLDKSSASVLSECNEKLLALSQTFETIARDSIQTLIASATDNAKKNLEERSAEISGNFTGRLEGQVRDYLEFIGDSIAEFPKKTPTS
jgi:DNA-binding protein YbaB